MNPIAQFNSGDLVPIVAICMTFGLPIIALLLHHQRKMAETIRGGQQQASDLAQLHTQIQHLSHLVHQNTIAIDDVRQKLALPGRTQAESSLEERIQG